MNIVVPIQWNDYSCLSQTVSELSAIGAPTRQLWLVLIMPFTFLSISFGLGVWLSAVRNRSLRIVGALMISNAVIGVFWPPMHLRGSEFTLTDSLHIVFAIVTVSIFLLEITFASFAFGKRFRLYSVLTMIVLLLFGTLTGLDGPAVAANLPTPWVGLWERISIGVYFLWVAVLAVVVLQIDESSTQQKTQPAPAKTSGFASRITF